MDNRVKELKTQRTLRPLEDKDKLDYHFEKYFEHYDESREQMKDDSEIENIHKFFKENKVTITKLNHSLDESVQRFTQFDGYIQLKDDDELVIMLKKPANT